jgi:hypothetical protein
MEDIANELVAYMDFLGYKTTLDAKESGGFDFRAVNFSDFGLPAQSIRGIHKDLRDQLNEITQKLKNPKSRLSTLREKLDKFEKDALHTSFDPTDFQMFKVTKKIEDRKTLEQFKEFLKDYYEKDDATSTGTSQGSSVDELTNTVGRMDLSPPPSVEEQRQLAMKRPFIEEKLADYSDVFRGKAEAGKVYHGGLEATGMKEHIQYGETHTKAKLTNALATEIRTRFFAGGVSQRALAEEYKIALPTTEALIQRKTWKHLPQVPGESDENFNKPNSQERKIIKIAKQYNVEPIRNKIGRLALPPELIKKLRKEKAEKKKESKE